MRSFQFIFSILFYIYISIAFILCISSAVRHRVSDAYNGTLHTNILTLIHAPTFTGVWSIDQEIKYTNTNIRQSTCGLYVDDWTIIFSAVENYLK